MTTSPDPVGGRYDDFLSAQRRHFAPAAGNGPLFMTDAAGLWQAFLSALPDGERQHHTCHACRHFVERFGGLVTIDDVGQTTPVMWGDAPDFYGPAFAVLRQLVGSAAVVGVFLSSEKTWGTPTTGPWRHMAVASPAVFRATALKTAEQAMAEKREEYGMLSRGLAEFGPEVVAQALTIVSADALYRVEKIEGVTKWLSALHATRARARGATGRCNVTWRAVATAPAGF